MFNYVKSSVISLLPLQRFSVAFISHISASSSSFTGRGNDTHGASVVAPIPVQHCEYISPPTAAAAVPPYIFIINTRMREPVKRSANVSMCFNLTSGVFEVQGSFREDKTTEIW